MYGAIMFKFISIIGLFAIVETNAAISRRLIITENTGMTLRGNTLYVPQTRSTPSDKDLSATYQIVCSPPMDVSAAQLSWNPTPTQAQGSVNITTNSAILYLKANADPVMNFTCTCAQPELKLETTTFKFYRRDDTMLRENDMEHYVNVSNSNPGPLLLVCKPPADPLFINNPTVLWYIDDNQILSTNTRVQTFDGNGTLLINYPSYMDLGIIMCRCAADPKRLYFFNVTGPAYIPPKQSSWWVSMDMTEGYTVKINYTVYGNPLNSSNVVWKRTVDGKVELIDKDFTAKHTEYKDRLFFNPTPEGPNGELELRDLVKSDRAEFTLFVENAYGRANFTTLVRVRGKLDALWPFLGIVIEVILLVGIIFFYERKRAKEELLYENDYAQGKKSLTTTVNETEDNLRLRKL